MIHVFWLRAKIEVMNEVRQVLELVWLIECDSKYAWRDFELASIYVFSVRFVGSVLRYIEISELEFITVFKRNFCCTETFSFS